MKIRTKYKSKPTSVWSNRVKSVNGWVSLILNKINKPIRDGIKRSDVLRTLRFSKHCASIARSQGERGLCERLKAYKICLRAGLGNYKLPNPPRVARTRCGLPRIIPKQDRKVLRRGGKDAILLAKVWMTFFDLNRLLKWEGKAIDISPIISPYKGDEGYLSSLVKNIHFRELYEGAFGPLPEFKFLFKTFPILKSGPLKNRTSAESANEAILSWWRHKRNLMEEIKNRTGALGKLFLPKCKEAYSVTIYRDGELIPKFVGPDPVRPFGRLAVKREPGKNRVFAMVDSMTQWLLYPFHSYLFKILSRMDRVDGTFQHRVAAEKFASRGGRRVYSFDLSNATDRLPMRLQEAIIQQLTKLGKVWRKIILTDFEVPSNRRYINGYPELYINYKVGQPMGALSSWAALAVTHHYLVQIAAEEAGIKTWYGGYCIIGDDIVIRDQKVARAYKTVMSKLGVPINMAKSVVSVNGTFEFAKRTFWRNSDISSVPVRLLDTAGSEMASLYSLMLSELKYYPHLREPRNLVSLRGRGYRAKAHLQDKLWNLSKQVRNTFLFATLPNCFYALSTWVEWSTQDSWRHPTFCGIDRIKEYVWSRAETLYNTSDMKRFRGWMEYRARLKEHPINPFEDSVVRWKQDKAYDYFSWLDHKSKMKKWFEEHTGESLEEIHDAFVRLVEALQVQALLTENLNLSRVTPKDAKLGLWVKVYKKLCMLPVIRSVIEELSDDNGTSRLSIK